MFQKGEQSGYSRKEEALSILPEGTVCKAKEAHGIRGYVIILPNGKEIVSAGSAKDAWEKAYYYELRLLEKNKKENPNAILDEFGLHGDKFN